MYYTDMIYGKFLIESTSKKDPDMNLESFLALEYTNFNRTMDSINVLTEASVITEAEGLKGKLKAIGQVIVKAIEWVIKKIKEFGTFIKTKFQAIFCKKQEEKITEMKKELDALPVKEDNSFIIKLDKEAFTNPYLFIDTNKLVDDSKINNNSIQLDRINKVFQDDIYKLIFNDDWDEDNFYIDFIATTLVYSFSIDNPNDPKVPDEYKASKTDTISYYRAAIYKLLHSDKKFECYFTTGKPDKSGAWSEWNFENNYRDGSLYTDIATVRKYLDIRHQYMNHTYDLSNKYYRYLDKLEKSLGKLKNTILKDYNINIMKYLNQNNQDIENDLKNKSRADGKKFNKYDIVDVTNYFLPLIDIISDNIKYIELMLKINLKDAEADKKILLALTPEFARRSSKN